MWRAYGGDTNVAFVFKSKAFLADSTTLTAYLSPALYKDIEGFKPEFLKVVEQLESNFELLQEIGPKKVMELLTTSLHFAALSTKHPGFSEEKEWRVIHSPTLTPSDKIEYQIKTIQGVPQKIYKLKLTKYLDDGLVNFTLSEILEKIIIGPTENPFLIYEALSLALEKKGVPDPWEKVIISEIPLRN